MAAEGQGFARLLAAALAVAGVIAAAPAGAAMSADEVKSRIEKEYGVQVLKVTPVEREGAVSYAVTVMNRGGDFNTAFMVTTLEVDAESGELVRQFRHLESGIVDAGQRPRATNAPLMGPAR